MSLAVRLLSRDGISSGRRPEAGSAALPTRGVCVRFVWAAAASILSGVELASLSSVASAETIAEALAATYANNPTVNSARADVRAVDENVAIVKSGIRPNLSAFGNGSGSSIATAFSTFESVTYQSALGLQVEQPLFRGFQVRNTIRAAEIGVKAQREFLRNTTENTLFDAAQTYLDVALAREIRELRRRNVAF